MFDVDFGYDGNVYGCYDFLDYFGIVYVCYVVVFVDVGGYVFECYYGGCVCCFGDVGLVGGYYVYDDVVFEYFGEVLFELWCFGLLFGYVV